MSHSGYNESVPTGSFITNCWIEPREGETLFKSTPYGLVATLDGYALIPFEKFNRLVELKERLESLVEELYGTKLP